MAKQPKTNLDQLDSVKDIIRGHIAKAGSFYGYGLNDFDVVVSSFENESAKENFLQELFDALPATKDGE